MPEEIIRVFVCRCDSLELEQALPLLSAARRAGLARLPEEDARRSAAAGLLLRTACLSLLGSPPGEELRDAAGRPSLPDHPGFFFSLSHSGDWALCAAGPTPVGADIQELRPISDALKRRFFSASEQSLCRDDASAIRLWCARESYGKLVGHGVSRADIACERDGALWIGGLRIAEPPLAAGYCAAVCSAGPIASACTICTQEILLLP